MEQLKSTQAETENRVRVLAKLLEVEVTCGYPNRSYACMLRNGPILPRGYHLVCSTWDKAFEFLSTGTNSDAQ